MDLRDIQRVELIEFLLIEWKLEKEKEELNIMFTFVVGNRVDSGIFIKIQNCGDVGSVFGCIWGCLGYFEFVELSGSVDIYGFEGQDSSLGWI